MAIRIFLPLLLLALATCARADVFNMPAGQTSLQFVAVGDPGNAANPSTGIGAVNYTYEMGKYDVTNSQYVQFLNANDSTGSNTLGLYSASMGTDTVRGGITNSGPAGSPYTAVAGRENWPVNYVSFYSTIRFTNWLTNGQIGGGTETGAYTLLGGTPTPSNNPNIPRASGNEFVLPTESEWYKAAYFNAATNSYFLYPFRSNTIPTASAAPGDNNSANYHQIVNIPTDVGSYRLSVSPYGAFDMGGDLYQITETYDAGAQEWVLRGGSYNSLSEALRDSFSGHIVDAQGRVSGVGFRVAFVPEPSTIVLAVLAFGIFSASRWMR